MGKGASYDAPRGATQVLGGGRVAAMPSSGLKHKLGVAVLTAALFALPASAASAKQAWVWACHGPDGAPIASTMDTTGNAAVDCARARAPGATLRLDGPSSTPAGVAIALPSGVTASSVVVTHRV